MSSIRQTLLVTWTIALVSSCGMSGRPEEAEKVGTEMVRIDIASQPYLLGTVYRIALEEGYFAEEGIDFHHHPATETGAHSVPALDRGRVDIVSLANPVTLVNAVDLGARIRAVAGSGYFSAEGCSFAGLVARRGLFEEGEIVTPESLEGMRIDFNPLTFEGFFLDTFLNRGGLSLDDVEQVYLPLPARMEAMNRGAIDMTVISEPWLTRMVEEGHQAVLMVDDVVPDLQYSILAFGSRLLEEEREAGRRFVAAYLRAVRQFNEGPTPRNVEIASEFTGLDPETVRRVCWPPIREDGRIEEETLLAYQRWALEKGLIDRIVDIEELWDPYFTAGLRESAPTDGR